MLELYASKAARTVLRGGGAGNSTSLPGHLTRPSDLFPVAHSASVCAAGVAAGPVSFIVRLQKGQSG